MRRGSRLSLIHISTEQRLISGIGCSPDTALEEFRYIKQKYGKEDGRSYYHIVQSFSPNDNLTPETAHEIGLKFAEYFPGFQILVATHCNTGNIHNHLIMNSVSFENGKKFHQSRDGLLQVKAYSNKLCREYGLSVTEEKCSYGKLPESLDFSDVFQILFLALLPDARSCTVLDLSLIHISLERAS